MSEISAFQITERRCKVCMSALRGDIDAMLLGDATHEDGTPYVYGEIVDWAAVRDFDTSKPGLSRHYTKHVQPSMRMYLETTRNMQALEQATGKKLSLHSVFANVVTSKILRTLDHLGEDALDNVDLDKLLRIGMMAGRNMLHIEKAEEAMRPAEMAEKVGSGLEKKGVSKETIALIEREILGMG